MNHYKRCPKCGSKLKSIPFKKIGTSMIVELYCDKCDVSITLYPDLEKIKFEPVNFF